ncbi:SPRY domain-containing SOCS box protein [Acrasis kona]|uniref:SPRY domain-containing SOCS box protein n=1 Tax=Acrasis kona TaxID=1008807 RepID=A0AAW2Z360_9EUKA
MNQIPITVTTKTTKHFSSQARVSIDALQRYGATVTDHRRLSFDGNYHNDLSDELRLSGDILYHIFIFMEPRCLVNFGLTCKGAYSMIHGVTVVDYPDSQKGRLSTPGGQYFSGSPTSPISAASPIDAALNAFMNIRVEDENGHTPTSPKSPKSPISGGDIVFEEKMYPQTITVADWLWKQMCFNYSKFDEEKSEWPLSPGCRSWKDEFRELITYAFIPIRTQQQYGKFSNHFRTVRNVQNTDNWWETFRTKKAIVPGHLYTWEVCVDHLAKHQANTWWILIGVETPMFPYATQLHYEDVIGYHATKHKGIGLNIGTGQVIHAANYDPYIDAESIAAGDIVGVKVDYRGSEGTIEFFKNRKSLGVVKRKLTGEIYYPTVSLVNGQKVTIRYWNGRTYGETPPNLLARLEDEDCEVSQDMFKNNEFQYGLYYRRQTRRTMRHNLVKRLSLRSPRLSPLNTPNTPTTPTLAILQQMNNATPNTPTRRRDCIMM